MSEMSLSDQWLAEQRSAWLYERVAEAETELSTRRLFKELGRAATRQADLVAAEISAAGGRAPVAYEPDARARVVAVLARAFGPRRVRPALAAMKIRGLSVYDGATPSGHALPRSVDDFGHRHRGTSALNLRAAVFGVNDGLVSNTSLVLGVAGATGDASSVVVAGVAGLLAGAFSMAAGEYVSVRSQRELYDYQIALEREEVELYPEEEAEELALIYRARGLGIEEARSLAREIFTDPQRALDTLAIEELGVNPSELGSPSTAAGSSFAAFAMGASVPLLPHAIMSGPGAIVASMALAAGALFGVGAAISLLTGRSTLLGGLRMLVIGAAAGAATYTIGSLLGVALS